MIPTELRKKVAVEVADQCHTREDFILFLITFSSLNLVRAMEYALEEMKETDDEEYKKFVFAVVTIVTNHINGGD